MKGKRFCVVVFSTIVSFCSPQWKYEEPIQLADNSYFYPKELWQVALTSKLFETLMRDPYNTQAVTALLEKKANVHAKTADGQNVFSFLLEGTGRIREEQNRNSDLTFPFPLATPAVICYLFYFLVNVK